MEKADIILTPNLYNEMFLNTMIFGGGNTRTKLKVLMSEK